MFSTRIPKIKGTKKFFGKNQPVISLGLPSLDAILGGGLPLGSSLLLEEDEFGTYATMVLKHYLAEGVVNDHPLSLAGQDIDTKKLVADLPSPLIGNANQGSYNDDGDQLRIAWRYQDLPSKLPSNAPVFGNTYNLGNSMMKSELEKVNIDHWNSRKSDHSYDDLLAYLKKHVDDAKYNLSVPVENRTVLRVALCSLGTASWVGDIVKFLINLRILIRNSCVTCLITVPTGLFQEFMLHRCEHFCDTVIEMKSFLYDANLAYSDYEGLLILKKLPVINAWCPTIPDSNDWAFKLKKKRFIIERLHISPELNEQTHREEEDMSNDYKTQRVVSNIAQEF
ncbi:hypothetical protein V9T40_008502 [Parthenolecanium corni]|uniref:Elongator complex protein 4 n=1 Tax=Parthenolecanium corni TaxID=536013 RepID=A0AAN9TN77_9HEMI